MGAIHFSVDMRLIAALRSAMPLRIFVETGTFRGDTTAAVASAFGEVYTVELSRELFEGAARRLAAFSNVSRLCGESPRLLALLRPKLSGESVLYWLDAHWCGSGTAGVETECPLLAELDAIAALNTDSAILIDDARLFLAAPPVPHDPRQWPLLMDVVERLRSLSREHGLWIVNDVIVFAPKAARHAMTEYARSCGIGNLSATPPPSNAVGQHAQRALQFNAELLGQNRSERIFVEHLRRLGIERVLDIGSNSGQFAQKLRSFGYLGLIYSVEPQAAAYLELLRNASGDLRWFPLARQGAGSKPGFLDLNVAENGWSSSLLEVHDNHLRAERTTRIVGRERIYVASAGALLDPALMADIEAVKIDVQGYEDRVLDGYAPQLDNVRLLMLELSMVECYRGARNLFALDERLTRHHGFARVSLEPAYYDDVSGVVQQYDGIYHRPERPRKARGISGARVSAVVTSIAGPLHRSADDGSDVGALWLDTCVASWRRLSREIVSVAEAPPPASDVRWAQTKGKPGIATLLRSAGTASGSHVLLLNADIAVRDSLLGILPVLDPNAAYYGHRLDVRLRTGAIDSLQVIAPYEAGFDFFLLPTRFLSEPDPPSLPEEFRVGEPWWDYLLPLLLLARGLPLKKFPPQAALALHLLHPTRYAHDRWLEVGARFLEHVAELQRAGGGYATGILDEIASVPGDLEQRLRRVAMIICRGLP
jgi:FkbM family methyltransferase